MCNKVTDIYACGDEEVHEIPCSSLEEFDKDCPRKEDDVVNIHSDTKCLECIHLDDQIKRLAEDKDLAAPVRPALSKPDSPMNYFKQKTHWSVCGHYDSPTNTSVERQGSPEEWLVVEERGRCWGCTHTNPVVLAQMKLCGELGVEDPFGALEREPAANTGLPGPGFQKSSVAHVEDEDLMLDAHPARYRTESDDEAYRSDYSDDEKISRESSLLTTPAVDKSGVSYPDSTNSIDECLPSHDSTEHMLSSNPKSSESLQNLPYRGSGASQRALTQEDFEDYISYRVYAVPPTLSKNMGDLQKTGNGERRPQRPARNFSESHYFRV